VTQLIDRNNTRSHHALQKPMNIRINKTQLQNNRHMLTKSKECCCVTEDWWKSGVRCYLTSFINCGWTLEQSRLFAWLPPKLWPVVLSIIIFDLPADGIRPVSWSLPLCTCCLLYYVSHSDLSVISWNAYQICHHESNHCYSCWMCLA